MWGFLSKLLEDHGAVTVLCTTVGMVMGLVVRILWKANQRLYKQIEALQEKRIKETQKITTEVLTHTEHVRQSVDKIGTAMDVLINITSDQRR